MITIWLENIDVTKVFFMGIIVGIIMGQFVTLLLQGLFKWIQERKMKNEKIR